MDGRKYYGPITCGQENVYKVSGRKEIDKTNYGEKVVDERPANCIKSFDGPRESYRTELTKFFNIL